LLVLPPVPFWLDAISFVDFFLWGRVCVALFHWVYADVVRHSYNYRIHSAFALMGAWEVIPSTAHVYSLIDKPVL
jgi:hypothetical protein